MSRVPILVTAAAIVILTSTVGCSAPDVTYVDSGATYDADEVFALADKVDAGDLSQAPAAEAAERRHDALVDLRGQGDAASKAASLITDTFPAEAVGVPFYVENATFESTPALVIVESIGRSGGRLSDVRVWAISLDGDVLLSGTR